MNENSIMHVNEFFLGNGFSYIILTPNRRMESKGMDISFCGSFLYSVYQTACYFIFVLIIKCGFIRKYHLKPSWKKKSLFFSLARAITNKLANDTQITW